MSDEILIRLPGDQLPGFDTGSDRLGLVFGAEDVFILRRQPGAQAAAPRDHLRAFASSRAVWVADLIHALNLNHASGLLVFHAGEVRKELYLRGGEIVFAQSNQSEDRLGESLVRAGKLDEQQLAEASEEVTEERMLGRILVDRSWITPKELFLGVRRQVEEIVWSLLDLNGHYLFYEGFADPEQVISLNLDTYGVLVEGIRRSAHFREIPRDLPEREVVVQLVANPKNLGLNPAERRIVALAASGVTLRDLMDQSGLGVFETYRVVYHLVDRDVIWLGRLGSHPESAHRRDERLRGDLAGTVYNFQSIFQDIISILRQRLSGLDVIAQLNSFFDVLSPQLAAVFGDARFREDGSLDIDAIVDQVVSQDLGRTMLLRAFNELLYFVLFEMKDHLSEEDSARLMEIIEHMEIF